MQIRMLQPGEEMQLARMKWLHCQEDDRGYGEHNLDGADYATFAAEFTAFLRVSRPVMEPCSNRRSNSRLCERALSGKPIV